MRRSGAFVDWWPLLLAVALFGCGKAERDDCPELSCMCPETGFQYAGKCVDGARVCECPSAPARQLSCSFESCQVSHGSAEGVWKLIGACPRQFSSSETCGDVSELGDLSVHGMLIFGDSTTKLQVAATLVSDQTAACGQSCEAIEASFNASDVSCEAGTDGLACRCTRPYQLESQLVLELPQAVIVGKPNGEIITAQYCQEGDSLILSAPELDLQLARTTCAPGLRQCQGHAVLECGPDGEWLPLRPCEVGQHCWQTECRRACAPGALYCDELGEHRCSTEEVRLPGDPGQPCVEGASCVDGSGCQGPRELELGVDLASGSLSNIAFAGQVIEANADVTLTDYAFDLTTYGPSSTLEWQVYESSGDHTGPFQLMFSAASEHGPAVGEHSSPSFAVEMQEGRFYLLGVGVPASVIMIAGVPGAPNAVAQVMGALYLLAPPADGFIVERLSTEPISLVGHAHFGS